MISFFGRPLSSRQNRFLALLIVSLYILLFLPLYRSWGLATASLALLPVAAVAWAYGRNGGIVAGLLAIFIHALLLYLGGVQANGWLALRNSATAPGSFILIATGWIIGWLRDLNNRYERELLQRQRIEAALRQKELHYQSILANAPVIFYALDRQGYFTLSEGKGLQAIGLKSGQVVAQSVYDLYSDLPALIQAMEQALSGYTTTCRLTYGEINFEVWNTPHYDENNDIVGVLGVAYDVTAQQQLAEDRERLLRQVQRQQSILMQLLTHPAMVKGNLERALPIITAAVADALPIDYAAAWRFQADGKYLLCLNSYRRSDQSHTSGERLDLSRYPHYVAALNEGLALVVPDTFNDRRTRELSEDYWQPNDVRATIEAPIWLHGQVAGVLCLEHTGSVRAWNPEEIAFATHAAEVVGQAFLNADIHQRADALATLQSVSADIMIIRKLSVLLKVIVQRAASLAGVSAGELYLDDPDEQNVRCVVSYGVERDYTGTLLPYGQGAAGIVAQTGRPLIVDNYHTWPDRLEPERAWNPSTAVLSVPLTRGRVTGVLNVVGYEPGKQFTTADLQLLTLFANHAAVSIENAQLIQETEQHARTANLLNQVITVAVSAGSEDKVLKIICQQLTDFFGSARAGIAVLDEDGAYETVVAEYPTDLFASAIGHKIPVAGNPAMQAIFLSGAPLAIADVLTHPITAPVSDMLQRRNVVSMLLVPILIQGEGVGTLGIDADRPRLFTSEEINLAQTVGEKIGQILETVRLYQRLHHYTVELEDRVAERTYELAEANRRLRQLDRLKSKFIRDMSHELRTPISSVVLLLDLMARGKPEKQAHYLSRLKNETGRLVDLIEGVLNVTRLEMEQDTITFDQVSLKTLLDQVIDSYRTRAKLSGLRLIYHADEELPAVRGNSGWLYYIINNLLANALRYTDNGEVRVRLYREENCICLDVADTGPGIDPEDIPHLFDRFYRGRIVSQSNKPGAGLGLAIVKESVDLHGGRITVESEMGNGSRFLVWLPI